TAVSNAATQAVLRPEFASLALNLLTTSVLYQPFAFGDVVASSSVIEGLVLSILKAAESIAVAVLPATSVHELELTLTALLSPEVVFACLRPPVTVVGN